MMDAIADDDIWKDDLLNRRSDAEFLIQYIAGRTGRRREVGQSTAFVLNIDAPWGDGKTFFLDRFGKHLNSKGYRVARINAWESDNSTEPMLHVMAALKSLFESASNGAGNNAGPGKLRQVYVKAIPILAAGFKNLAKHNLAKLIGEDGITDAAEALTQGAGEEAINSAASTIERLVVQTEERNDALTEFKKALQAAIAGHANNNRPIFILVDELDRCRPTYAVSMLEEIKHLFEVDGLCFVIATDTRQLCASIRGLYGQGYDAETYLHRFFTRQYSFVKPSTHGYINYLCEMHDIQIYRYVLLPDLEFAAFVAGGAVAHELSLRDISQIVQMIGDFQDTWDSKLEIHLVYLLPLIIEFHQNRDLKSIEAYYNNTKIQWICSYREDGQYEKPNIINARIAELISRYRRINKKEIKSYKEDAYAPWDCLVKKIAYNYNALGREYKGEFRLYERMVKNCGRLSRTSAGDD